MTKISLIGAGSVVFAKNLIGDILQFPELANTTTICLMDIDAARLRVAEIMTRRMVDALGVRARVEATTALDSAIRDANYVICTIQVGGYKPGTVIDFEIPKRYGLQQTIADTLGVGGVFRALRTIPEILKIATAIERLGAPDCLLLNYTNPMAMLCMAVDHAIGIPHVGLCHSVQGTFQQLVDFARLDRRDVTYKVAGINHMAFFLEFRYRGKDAYPLLFEALDDPARTTEKVRFEMMRRLGYFVTESSEHQSEYVPYFIHHGEAIIDAFDIPIDEYLRRCEAIIASWESTEKELLGGEGGISISPRSHEYGSYIIHSRETNTPRVIYGNVPNLGHITNLPHRCCVEVPVLVDAMGLQPTHIGALPPQLAAICRSNINVQELAVTAALSKKREHIYHAVMADPHTAATLTLDKIWSLCDDLIEAHQKVGLLGEFDPVRPGTGASARRVSEAVTGAIFPATTIRDLEGELNFVLQLQNTGSTPFSSTIQVSCDVDDVVLPGVEDGVLSVSVGPGATEMVPFKVKSLRPVKAFTLHAEHPAPNVIIRSYTLRDRRRVAVVSLDNSTSVTEKGTPFELSYVGNRAAWGHIAIVESDLVIQGYVADTAVRTDERRPWEGSSLELFFRDEESAGEITQIFLLPTGQGRLMHHGTIFDPATLQLETDKGGYAFRFSCPITELGIGQGDAFLLDMIANLGALGEAHGRSRVYWNEPLESFKVSDHYAHITVRQS